MSTIQFWLLFGFGLLLIALALDVWLRMKQAREEAQKRVAARLRAYTVKGGPMYGVPTLPVDKIEIPPLPFDRLRVTDELPDVTFAPTDDEIADWLQGRKRKQGA